MNFRRAFLMLLALGAGSLPAQQASPQPVPIDAILLRPNLWEATAQELEPNLKELRFEWTSSNHDIARSAVSGLAFQKQSLNEAVISFVNGKLAEVRLLYFDRGDSGTLPEEQFRARLTEITGTLTALTGRQPTDRGRDALGAVKAEGRIWETDRTRYLLEWSVTKESRVKMIPFRGEFIRLAVRPKPSERALGAPTAVTSRDMVKSFVGPDHVERRGDGDVRLKDVPMVDQGGKGYCVVASVERVMRYYGVSVDQHELAQIANSDAARGTSMDAMLASLKRLTARLGVRVRLLYEWDARDFLKTIDGYNRAAKRGKLAPELDPGRMVDMDSCFAQMRPEIFKEVRMKNAADFGKFKREVQRSIDQGVPLLWFVRLGLVKEKEIPQAAGGHTRIIIGYNPTTDEVLYSDPWGKGHEEKRMQSDDAWTITGGLSSLQPIS
jgi:hypothetical protein